MPNRPATAPVPPPAARASSTARSRRPNPDRHRGKSTRNATRSGTRPFVPIDSASARTPVSGCRVTANRRYVPFSAGSTFSANSSVACADVSKDIPG